MERLDRIRNYNLEPGAVSYNKEKNDESWNGSIE